MAKRTFSLTEVQALHAHHSNIARALEIALTAMQNGYHDSTAAILGGAPVRRRYRRRRRAKKLAKGAAVKPQPVSGKGNRTAALVAMMKEHGKPMTYEQIVALAKEKSLPLTVQTVAAALRYKHILASGKKKGRLYTAKA